MCVRFVFYANGTAVGCSPGTHETVTVTINAREKRCTGVTNRSDTCDVPSVLKIYNIFYVYSDVCATAKRFLVS